MILLVSMLAAATPSDLYGERGELWDPVGRLPDFSYAGYHAGEQAPPSPAVVASVAEFGATGDGATDDTAAVQAAIDATSGGALLFPAGTYVISDVLSLSHGDIVLRGEGPDTTVFDIDVSLADVRGAAPQWSWNGGLLWVEGPRALPTAAAVTTDALRGDDRLLVDDAQGITAGQMIVVDMVDGGDGSLGRHLHNDQFEGGNCSYQVPLRLRWPVIVSDVVDNEVLLAQPLRIDVRLAWTPTVRAPAAIGEIGIEGIGFEFPDVPYAGHLNEPGYNGIFVIGAVRDSWIRDVSFHNADNGILVDQLTKRLTITDIALTGRKGHHGFNIAFAADGLYDGIDFQSDYVHHLTVDHRANGNVFKNVTSAEPCRLDHHRDSPFENLFTAFDAEISFFHGGNQCAGHPAGARETMWGLPGPLVPPYWSGAQANVVGELTLDDRLTEDAEWYENVADLEPVDLHEAQLAHRLGTDLDTDTDSDADTEISDPSCGCATQPNKTVWLAGLVVLGVLRRRSSSMPSKSNRELVRGRVGG